MWTCVSGALLCGMCCIGWVYVSEYGMYVVGVVCSFYIMLHGCSFCVRTSDFVSCLSVCVSMFFYGVGQGVVRFAV